MKHIIIIVFAIMMAGTCKAQENMNVEMKGNTWYIEGNTELDCDAVKVALIDANGRVMKVVGCRLDFGHFSYAMDPLPREIKSWKVKCY